VTERRRVGWDRNEDLPERVFKIFLSPCDGTSTRGVGHRYFFVISYGRYSTFTCFVLYSCDGFDGYAPGV